ncbi:hypothetical protein EMCRGX_G014447 [Ephydatia muelleri]
MDCKTAVTVLFCVISIVNLLVSIERLVFDVMGQMWGPALVEEMTCLCILLALLGACAKKKVAIGVYLAWSIASIGINIVFVLIYQNVGLLKGREEDLGLRLGDRNWWRDFCVPNGTSIAMAAPEQPTVTRCPLSYADIETAHAVFYMAVNLVATVMAAMLMPSNKSRTSSNEDTESFSYVSIGAYRLFPRLQSLRRQSRTRRAMGSTSLCTLLLCEIQQFVSFTHITYIVTIHTFITYFL